ncbi:MAG: hypothetical protein Q9220_004740 [cf. Caloplaca sp. 1 TL-2023]
MAQYQDNSDEPHFYRSPFVASKMDSALRIDEGYSEDARSQDEIDSPMRMDDADERALTQSWSSTAGVPHQIMSLSEADRSDFVYSILRTLRTSSIAAIVDRLRPLLHIDPVSILPPEITSEVFSYLTPTTLLEASRVSRAWRERALDSRLWRHKFSSEGWGLDMTAIRRFEQSYKSGRKARSRRAEATGEQSRQKKRVRADSNGPSDLSLAQKSSGHTPLQDVRSWNEQQGEVEADDDNVLSRRDSPRDQDMYDEELPNTAQPAYPSEMQVQPDADGPTPYHEEALAPLHDSSGVNRRGALFPKLDVEQALVRYDRSGQPQINYNYVYKQKRKLEENWESGSYQSFQLPHRDHPEEAHRECVYTIQYCGNYLVSGSRDKTLRKWDLETQRLIGKPLVGHTASVLCLQFDSSEDEDMIVSGSSDTDVIIWQFSTGEMIKKIARAHEESVLNLKFDSRFLVTCSKDKTIKIWNRHELRPGDRDYPVKGVDGGGSCPAYILDLREMGGSVDIDRHLTAEEKAPIPSYTPIMILESHNAAVNAIHIYQDQLVSASGDRHVHLWDIHTGVRTSVCRGHTKGIACVQYDGRRIVSGSSDNTIRIFDPITQAEVACLKGHTRLVRTIQSAFGDLPGRRELLEAEAVEIDGKFHEAHRAGKIPKPTQRTRERNPGSKDPKDIMALGAKLPPGGGGSRWGRIVSGSYDETIIIWKKLTDGRWAKAHVLRQEEALRAAGGPLLSHSDLANQAHHQALAAARTFAPQPTTNVMQPLPNPQSQGHQINGPNQAPMLPVGQAGQQAAAGPSQAAAPSVPHEAYQFLRNHNPYVQQRQQALIQQRAQDRSQHAVAAAATLVHGGPDTIPQHPLAARMPAHQQQQFASAVANAQNTSQNMHPPPIPLPHETRNQSNNQADHPLSTPQVPQQTQPQPQPQPQPPPAPAPQPQQQHQHHHPGVVPHHRNLPHIQIPISQPNARVFKLQFDARRIICCSQDPKIVGWDFANGNEKIIECSPFFATPQ